MARRYTVVRTDRDHRDFIQQELALGRLRQGWGSRPDDDLRLLSKKKSAQKLNEHEARVWRNRRLLDSEPDGLKPGDVVVLPNLPEQGQWTLARVTGGYDFSPVLLPGLSHPDYGHIVAVTPIREPGGQLAIVEADNHHVDARLRASMRNQSRMWSVDALGSAVDALIRAIETGEDIGTPEPEVRKADGFFKAVRSAAWQYIESRYKGAELEHLIQLLFERIYTGGRVERSAGPGEKGADLIVFTQDPLGIEYKIAVQVKRHDGVEHETRALRQIEQARGHHRIDAGVVVTTAEDVSDAFQAAREALEEKLGIDIRVVTRDELVELVMTNLSKLKSSPGLDIAALLRESATTQELRERTPVTDHVWEELQQLRMTQAQRDGMKVMHRNRGDGAHILRVEVPGAPTAGGVDSAAQRVLEHLQQIAREVRGSRAEASVASAGTSTLRIDMTLELP